LRFWFEVYCHAVGIPIEDHKKEKIDVEEFKDKTLNKLKKNLNKNLFEIEDEILAEREISLPSRIFGCTGWKGIIQVKLIQPIENRNKLNFPEVIYKNKTDPQDIWKTTKKREVKRLKLQNKEYHFWYFGNSYFWGKFNIKFQITKETKNILLSLLNFIQQYGFIGGENNLGYGRIKIKVNDKNINNETFEFSKFKKYSYNSKQFSNYKSREITDAIDDNKNSIEDLIKTERKIGFWKIGNTSSELIKIIEKLISIKANSRKCFKYKYKNNDNLRYFIFGNARGELQATKIIPWINKIGDKSYEYGFISLVGLKHF